MLSPTHHSLWHSTRINCQNEAFGLSWELLWLAPVVRSRPWPLLAGVHRRLRHPPAGQFIYTHLKLIYVRSQGDSFPPLLARNHVSCVFNLAANRKRLSQAKALLSCFAPETSLSQPRRSPQMHFQWNFSLANVCSDLRAPPLGWQWAANNLCAMFWHPALKVGLTLNLFWHNNAYPHSTKRWFLFFPSW